MAKKTQGLGYITHQIRNGRKYYTGWISVGLKDDGTPNKKTKSSYSLQEVRDWIKKYNTKTFTKNNQKPLKEIASDFINKYKVPPNVAITTTENYQGKIRQNLLPYPIADAKICDITEQMLKNYQNTLLAEKGSSINEFMMQMLKTIFRKLRDQGEIENNPATDIKIPKHIKQSRNALTYEEQRLILSELNLDDLRDLAIYMSLSLGLRLGEVCGLQWSDIKNGTITITEQFARIKGSEYGLKDLKTTSSYREIPIPYASLPEIEKRRSTGYIFSDDGNKPFDRKRVQRRYKKICNKYNIDSTYHCTRHTFATNLAEKDVNPFVLKDLCGHAKIETTMKYTHITKRKMQEAINRNHITIEKINKQKQA